MGNRCAVKAKNENSLSARAIAYVCAREKTEEGARGVWGWGEKEEVFFQKVHVLLPNVREFFSQVAGLSSVVVGKCLFAAFYERAMRRRAMAIDGLLRAV